MVCKELWSSNHTGVTRWTVAGTRGVYDVYVVRVRLTAQKWCQLHYGGRRYVGAVQAVEPINDALIPGQLVRCRYPVVAYVQYLHKQSDHWLESGHQVTDNAHAETGMLQSDHFWVDGAQVIHRRHDVSITQLFHLDVGHCRHWGGGDSWRHVLHGRCRLSHSVHGDVIGSWRRFALDRNRCRCVGVSRRWIVFSRVRVVGGAFATSNSGVILKDSLVYRCCWQWSKFLIMVYNVKILNQ